MAPVPQPAVLQPGADLAAYHVTLHTSDLAGAGTTCTAHIVVYGAEGDTGAHTLDAGKAGFARGSVETCFIEAPSVGPMERIRVGHDDRGGGWYAVSVPV